MPQQMDINIHRDEEFFRLLYEDAPLPYQSLDKNGHFIDVNKAWSDILGYQPAEVIGRSFGDFLSEPYKAKFAENFSRFKSMGKISAVDYGMVKKDGSAIMVSCDGKVAFDAEGKFQRTHCILQDISRQLTAEKALRESETLFRHLFENMSNGVAIYEVLENGKDFIFKDLNPAGLQQTHLTKNEIIGKSVRDIFPGVVELGLFEIFQRVWQTGKPERQSASVYQDNRQKLWVENYVFKLPTGEIVAIYDDVSEQMLFKQLLQQREAKLKSILQSAPIGIGVVVNRVFQEVNQRFCEMVGYSEKELLDQDARMIYDAYEDYEYVGKDQREQISEQGIGNTETCFKHKNGKLINVIISWAPLNLVDLPDGITFAALDITEKKTIEKNLSASENKYQAMMESMKDLVYICSEDYRVEYVNPAMEARIGHSAIGEHCFKAIHDLNEKCPWCKAEKTFAGQYFESEVISPKDNHSYHVSHSPIVNDDGSLSNMIVFRDTTGIKDLESQLFQSRKMEAIGQLAGGVAHDFNNILTAISGYAEMSLEALEEGSNVWEDVQEITKSVERAANLTRQLLIFSRKQRILPTAINFNSLLNNLKKMLERLIGEDIRLEASQDNQAGKIHADPGQMEQIIVNLVVNARDALKNHPEVSNKVINISTSKVYLGDDYIPSHIGTHPGWHLLLEVSDNGCGMTSEVANHIFEPFFTTKAAGQGTGMGLATVYGIVKQNNGSIYVYSEPGQGTTFKIYWPIIKEKEEITRAAEETKESSHSGTEVILVAEDDHKIRKMICRKLRQKGYKVIEAENGLAALEKASDYQGDIDLLFTDVVMPVMGGKELNEKIKEIYPEIVTLFVSGYLDDSIHGDILTKENFINKPYNLHEVSIKLRQLLDQVLDENR